MPTLLRVTYTVTIPDDGATDAECDEARSYYGFAFEKHRRRMEAVTQSLRHIRDSFRDAVLEIECSDPVEWDKGAAARRIAAAKEEARGKQLFLDRSVGDK